jgi:hypothetical protein
MGSTALARWAAVRLLAAVAEGLNRRRLSKSWLAALVTVATLASPVVAGATPPQLTQVDGDGIYVSAGWTLPPGMSSWSIEISTGPATQNGSFNPEDLAFSDDLAASATTYESQLRLIAGTYYLHVSAYGSCDPNQSGCVEYSSAVQFDVPPELSPTLIAVGLNGRNLIATSASDGLRPDYIEAATSPEVYVSGPDAGAFLDEYTILADPVESGTRYESPAGFPGGTYYVHVASKETVGCDPPDQPSCLEYLSFSNTMSFVVTSGAPVLNAAELSGGTLGASWTLPPFVANDFIEVATNPETDSGGGFLAENVVFDDAILGARDTSYAANLQLPPGHYYVHLATLPSENCYSTDYSTCIDEYSATKALTIPGPAPTVAPAAAAPTQVPDTTTSFSKLKVAPKQRVGAIVVQASMAEAGTIRVAGTVSVPNASKVYKLKPVSVNVTAGKVVTIKIRLPKKALNAAKRALGRRKNVGAKLTITARDAAGNVEIVKRAVRLMR